MGKVATIGVAFVAGLILLVGAGAVPVVQSIFGSSSGAGCAPVGSAGSSTAGLDAQQTSNAAVIVAVGKPMNVPAQGWIVAIAAAIQESGLRNLNHGDRDSLGLFQQRPSQGWGTPEQIMNPTYAATQFYQHLLAVEGWLGMTVNDAAQAVQRSGSPDAYAQHELAASQVVATLQGVACATTGASDCNNIQAPNAAALAAINFACGQRGLPYVWGGNGGTDGGFDCSGLTSAAYNAAGIALPRTADAQFRAGPRVPDGQPLVPGDLVFYGNPATRIHHVGLYIGRGFMVDAPGLGQVVKTQPHRYKGDDYTGATRPVRYPRW